MLELDCSENASLKLLFKDKNIIFTELLFDINIMNKLNQIISSETSKFTFIRYLIVNNKIIF